MATGWNAIQNSVTEQIGIINNKADQYNTLSQQIINELTSLDFSNKNVATLKLNIPEINLGEVTLQPTPNVNKFGSISPFIDVPPPADVQFPETPNAFNVPAPSTNIDFSEPDYITPLQSLQSKIIDILSGSEINPNVEQAIFDRAKTRIVEENNASVQQAFDTFASRGFSMPPGMLVAQINSANEKAQLQLNDVNKEIFIQRGQWEIDAVKTALQSGVQWEGLLRDSHEKKMQRSFDLARIQDELNVSLFKVQSEVYGNIVSAYSATVQGVATVSRSQTERYTAQISAAKDKLMAEATAIEATARAYTADIEAYKAVSMAQISNNESKVRLVEERVRNDIAYFEVQIKEIDAELSRGLQQLQAHIAAIEAAGRIATQMAAGYTAALHVGASESATASLGSSRDQRISWEGDVDRDAPIWTD